MRRRLVFWAGLVLILVSACLMNVVAQHMARDRGYCIQICPLPKP